MAETKRTDNLTVCPKCINQVNPIILEFVPGTDKVIPHVPDRYAVKCPRPECGQTFHVRVLDGKRTDGQAVLSENRD